MILPPITPKAFFSRENYDWLESLLPWNEAAFKPLSDDEDMVGFCAELATRILEDKPQEFEQMLEEFDGSVNSYVGNPDFNRLIKLGLEYGVAAGDGACANYLGAGYYLGSFVEQDYYSAKELYEIAESKGIIQAMINLGYIYEYGRTAEPDYEKAYRQYAKAAALGDAPEALYKLGDMYSRGTVDGCDYNIAYYLYEKSLGKIEGDFVAAAQPAIRIAKMLIEDEYREYDIPYSPMRALELYQLAERGLRVDVAMGQSYYQNRLEEALAGQEKARELVKLQLEKKD